MVDPQCVLTQPGATEGVDSLEPHTVKLEVTRSEHFAFIKLGVTTLTFCPIICIGRIRMTSYSFTRKLDFKVEKCK